MKRTAQGTDEKHAQHQQEQISHINAGSQNKEEVAEDTGRSQSQQIVQRRDQRQTTEQDIHRSHQHHHECPQTCQKQRQKEGNPERRQRRIVIEMFPRIRHKDLHRLIQSGAEGHQQTKQQRIDTVYVAEARPFQRLAPQHTNQPKAHEQSTDDNKIRYMRVAK